MPSELTPFQRFIVHLSHSLRLCDHAGDIEDDIQHLWKIAELGDPPDDLEDLERLLGAPEQCDIGLGTDDASEAVRLLTEQCTKIETACDVARRYEIGLDPRLLTTADMEQD
jgi:hypothetical protein